MYKDVHCGIICENEKLETDYNLFKGLLKSQRIQCSYKQ